MDNDLDAKLCTDFPVLYGERNLPMTETCMCWGFPGNGWEPLIRLLSSFIGNVLENARNEVIYEYKKKNEINYAIDLSPDILKMLHVDDMRVVATQVKEKFGGLRFYYRSENLPERDEHAIDGAVAFAEAVSYITCEACGNQGSCNKSGWLSTRCEKCRAEGK